MYFQGSCSFIYAREKKMAINKKVLFFMAHVFYVIKIDIYVLFVGLLLRS